MSGYYLVKLSSPSRDPLTLQAQYYIIFVVREDDQPRTFLMNAAMSTYQAYNCFASTIDEQRSLYPCKEGGPFSTQVSFDRPYDSAQGTGLFFDPNPLGYRFDDPDQSSWPSGGFEYPMVRFLERGLGSSNDSYDVKYATDIDLHTSPALLNNVKGFLSVGHDEYWSKAMHDNLETARDAQFPHIGPATNVAFFSGNSVFWITSILPSSIQAGAHPNRIVETHKKDANPSWLWQNCPGVCVRRIAWLTCSSEPCIGLRYETRAA